MIFYIEIALYYNTTIEIYYLQFRRGKNKMPPVIDEEKCVGCGTCAQICPLDVLKYHKETRTVTVRYPDECWHCRACAIDCPKGAIQLRYPLSHMLLHMDAPTIRREELE